MRLLVIVNPRSRRGRAVGIERKVEAALRTRGVDYALRRTEASGHARELVAAEGADCDGIVVVGGDGTVHEVIQEIDLERHRLAVVPAGSGNDFAWMNGWPRDVRACVERIAADRVRRVDLGLWAGGRFHNSVGLGFEAEVNRESNRLQSPPGALIYCAALLECLRRRRSYFLQIDAGDGFWAGEVLMLSVGIGRRVGGAFRLFPDASNDDGLLDLCRVAPMGLPRLLALLPRTLRGGHTHSAAVWMGRAERVRIRCLRGDLPVHVDGEYVSEGTRGLDLRVLRGALRTF